MSRVIPFRRRSSLPSFLPIVLGAIAVAVIGFENFIGPAVQYIGVDPTRVEILRPTSNQPAQIDVIDGDTVRFNGTAYRLAGIDTPERGNRARCDDERRRAEAATKRLRALVASGNAHLTRVACACRPGLEGTRDCNYGRLCGSLYIGGQDAGDILISEGHARRCICGATSCPERWPWC
jgi:endonuclease YncB( thermonuclease family)